MPKTHLLVHPGSYRYVSAVVDHIFMQLAKHCDRDVTLVPCTSIDAANTQTPSMIFVVGDFYRHFTRRPACFYIFINFSLLYCLGKEKAYSRSGRGWVDTKHRQFAEKVQLYDYVIDFHSDQAARELGREFGISARHFMVGLRHDTYQRYQIRQREYDVGFVGVPTPRRVVLAKRLARMGLRVSPFTGTSLENVAARSKVVLNVHAYRTANVEWPRIVSALLSGAVLIAEASDDLAKQVPEHLYVSSTYRQIATSAKNMIDDSTSRERLALAAKEWMHAAYLTKCDESWKCLLESLCQHFEACQRTLASTNCVASRAVR